MPNQDQSRTDLNQFKTNLEQIASAIPFEERSFSPKQTAEILGHRETKTAALIASGALESYLDGRSRRITGRSIQAYRNRKLREATRKNETAQSGEPAAP